MNLLNLDFGFGNYVLFIKSKQLKYQNIYQFDLIPEIIYINNTCSSDNAVFLTHVSIQQMPTWLPTWKAKSLYHFGTFLLTLLCHFKSSKLSKQNCRKIPIPKQIHTYYIFQGILKIFSNTYALPLSLANCKQLRKCNCLYQSLLLAMFFLSIDVKIQSF